MRNARVRRRETGDVMSEMLQVNHDVAIKVIVVGMAVLVEASAIGPSGIVETADVALLCVTVIGNPVAGLTWLIQNHRHT